MVEPFLPAPPYAVSLDSFSATGIRNTETTTAAYGSGQLAGEPFDLTALAWRPGVRRAGRQGRAAALTPGPRR